MTFLNLNSNDIKFKFLLKDVNIEQNIAHAEIRKIVQPIMNVHGYYSLPYRMTSTNDPAFRCALCWTIPKNLLKHISKSIDELSDVLSCEITQTKTFSETNGTRITHKQLDLVLKSV